MNRKIYARFEPIEDMEGFFNNPPFVAIPPVKTFYAPICKCHNLEMRWYTDRSKKYGGSFRCPVKRAESQRRYNERRYSSNQIYRTGDVIRKRRKSRLDVLAKREHELRALRTLRALNL